MRTLSTALQNAINAGNPQRVLLVFKSSTSPAPELTNEDIVVSSGITLREDFNSQQNLTIGECPSSIFSFTALNDHGQLDDFPFGWFHAYLGARIDSGTPGANEITRTYTENGQTVTYAFDSLGVFYAERPTVSSKKTLSITAYDRMCKLDRDMPSSTRLSITYPTTIGGILQAIVTWMNRNVSDANWQYTLANPSFLNHDLTVSTEPDDFADATIRDVVGWIAEAGCSVARFNRDGNLQLCWFNSTESSYDEHNYSEFNHAWYSTSAIDGLYVRDMANGTETSLGTNKENNYLIQDNPFLRG